ncbi:heterokaryon incompatibility protein-domain-containing protein [Dendryphion nanum]|uniref:Heterokaryon incompatibility protein-domain-containing protein n=1 Tax=Dendryphion nanum TaxID=256645 RepID=A0A9P9IJB1_9PLEO|nr:heterokaryon incompatibility protein-domain-containing protein [Dendryphion nanum]
MRLLNTASLELSCLFVPSDVPDYVILSHRWSAEEVTFADITKAPISKSQSETRAKSGFAKIQGVCELASKDGYEWIWIDSCCIDKSSSAELQEAINSMWRYYEEANICYVYMADVPDAEAGWGHRFTESEWFTRGWTLQELIAPVCLEFYAGNWEPIGTKFERYRQIADITSINVGVLIRIQAIDLFSTAEKFSWASHRIVTREEDEAYSLLGIFDVNMPLLYGEGREKAFVRLQEAIYNSTADDSIFLFRHSLHDGSQPLLADSPRRFCDRKNCISCLSQGTHCLPPNFRYGDIIASERWSTQAHEQIMTTVTTVRNEMSTVLSLLTYRDICHKLEYLDNETPPSNVTDVAILNQTLEKYPQGALCLLLRRWPEQDGCLRLGAYPAILPHVKDFVSRLRKEKLLVCPDPKFPGSNDRINTIFSVESSLFRVETWSARGDTSHSTLSSQAGQRSDFEIQMGKTEGSKDSIQISCRVAHLQDPSQTFTIQLARVSEIWSIEKVFKRKQGTGTSRVHQGDYFLTMRYRISIDYNDN